MNSKRSIGGKLVPEDPELAPVQQEIIGKYGQKVIKVARTRLCGDCRIKGQYSACNWNLLPICRDGQDCPYYKSTGGSK